MKRLLFCFVMAFILTCSTQSNLCKKYSAQFISAQQNGILANEAFVRCEHYVHGWLAHADPATGLVPRNLTNDKDIWNAKDAAADNYPFLVLTSALLDQKLFDGRMREILDTETKLTSRLGNLPDTYSLSKKTFARKTIDVDKIIFGGSEYVKDGLLPLTEWLGPSPWSKRMIDILDDLWKYAPVKTKYGTIPSTSQEVNGEMLQVLSRIFWMTGEKKYLDWAIRLGDYYLFDHHPTRDAQRVRLRDHGCEILSGLTELYVAVHYARPEKKKAYQAPVYEMLDSVLKFGRNEHGMLYNWFNPQTGEHDEKLADTWGYNYNGFFTVYLIDGVSAYRDATLKALSHINMYYPDYNWEHNSADGDADATESALNLYNREPIASTAEWIDRQIQTMWSKQQDDGVIEGWYGDGNFARTSIMYALWKTKGLTIQPWRADVVFGAEMKDDVLVVTIDADSAWQGKLVFDSPRHRDNMHVPLDYPRINQFPEWFVVENRDYEIWLDGQKMHYSGQQLKQGLLIELAKDNTTQLICR